MANLFQNCFKHRHRWLYYTIHGDNKYHIVIKIADMEFVWLVMNETFGNDGGKKLMDDVFSNKYLDFENKILVY